MGRPKLKINWEHVDNLCGIHCTLREISDFLKCSEDTLERACLREQKMSFAEYFQQKKSAGAISLRRKQYQSAMAGNVTLLIWLGKQYLGQSEKVTSVNKTELNAKVENIDKDKVRKAIDELESEV